MVLHAVCHDCLCSISVTQVFSYLVMPFMLILASSMANVMWSWCSIPLATLLNAT